MHQEALNILEEKKPLRKSLGFDTDDFILICLDEMEEKNINFIIQLMTHLDKNVKLFLPRTKISEERIKKLYLEDRIYFWNQKDEAPIKIADLGIVSGTNEDKQRLIKAMSFELPLLALNKVNLIKNNVTGYFIEDENEIFSYINFLMNNQKFNLNLGLNGYFSIQSYLEQTNI